MRFDVLFEDGDWRVVRALSKNNKPKYGRWIIIQHRCGGGPPPGSTKVSEYSTGDWSFCLNTSKTCSVCNHKTDARMAGFHDMVMWDNEEDMP